MFRWITILAVLGVGLVSAQDPVQHRSVSKRDADWSKLKAEAPIKNVRVQLRTGETLRCTLDGVEEDSVLLRVTGSDARQVSRRDILQVTRRSHSIGALWGLGIGAAVGAIAGAAQGESIVGDYYFTRGESTAIRAATLAGIGAAIGAGIGKRSTLYRDDRKPAE